MQVEVVNGYVKNPDSGKLIKVGGKKYNEMLRKGMIEGQAAPSAPIDIPKAPKKESTIVAQETTKMKAVAKKKQLEAENPPPAGKVYAISNDQSKVLLRNKKSKSISAGDMAKNVAKATATVYSKLQGKYGKQEEFTPEVQELFENMILQEMANSGAKKKGPVMKQQHVEDTEYGTDDGSEVEDSEEDYESD